MTHKELVLATARAQDHGEWMVWTEPKLGSGIRWHRDDEKTLDCSPDVLLARKSWSRYEVRIIECKVKQSDLDQDVKNLKFEKYAPWCDRMSFIVGPGLKTDVLKDHPVGIMKMTANGPHTLRAPPRLAGEKLHSSMAFFHALNMSDSRFWPRARYERTMDAVDQIGLLDLRKKWHEQQTIRMDYLRKLIEKAEQTRVPVERIQREERRKWWHQMQMLLELKEWRQPKDLQTAIRYLVENEMHNAQKSIEEKINALVECLGEEAHED